MNPKEQNKLAGIFLLIHGAIQAFVMLILGLVYGGLGLAMISSSNKQDEQVAGIAFIVAMIVVFVASMVVVLPQLIGGWKLIKERPNARTWGIIGSIVSCLSFPFGTAAGVFGLIFLFGENGRQFYLGRGPNPGTYYPPQPPPPQSWQ